MWCQCVDSLIIWFYATFADFVRKHLITPHAGMNIVTQNWTAYMILRRLASPQRPIHTFIWAVQTQVRGVFQYGAPFPHRRANNLYSSTQQFYQVEVRRQTNGQYLLTRHGFGTPVVGLNAATAEPEHFQCANFGLPPAG